MLSLSSNYIFKICFQQTLNNIKPISNTRGDKMGSDWVIVKSKIKELVGQYNVSGDFSEVLNEKVKQMIHDSVKRAEANNRKTVMGRDL
jgi:hypothetical protein